MSESRGRKATARSVAYELLQDVSTNDAYANLVMPRLLKAARLETRDAAFAQELAFGCIRWQLFYDLVIEKGSNRLITEIDAKAKDLLRIGAHQLLGMRVPAHAAISETVDLAKQFGSQGSAGFVNGVLRRISEKTKEDWLYVLTDNVTDIYERFSIEYSHPVWIIRALAQALKVDGREHELEALLVADNEPALVNLVALPGLASERDVEGLQPGGASPIGFKLSSGDPNNVHAIREGRIRVQDQGSQLAALSLVEVQPIKPDELWLDMCAGPGGKAALLAAVAKQQNARLICNEVSEHRSRLVENALERFSANSEVVTADGRDYGAENPETFDRVLLDAPCTGLGALRRRPESRWRKTSKDIAELAKLQEQLIESAWLTLKPGGVLAYVTCSPHQAETIAIVEWLIKHHTKEVELLDANEVLEGLNSSLQLNRKRKTAQLWPQVHQTDAMFIALLRKSIG